MSGDIQIADCFAIRLRGTLIADLTPRILMIEETSACKFLSSVHSLPCFASLRDRYRGLPYRYSISPHRCFRVWVWFSLPSSSNRSSSQLLVPYPAASLDFGISSIVCLTWEDKLSEQNLRTSFRSSWIPVEKFALKSLPSLAASFNWIDQIYIEGMLPDLFLCPLRALISRRIPKSPINLAVFFYGLVRLLRRLIILHLFYISSIS